jgi:hypothetical protein
MSLIGDMLVSRVERSGEVGVEYLDEYSSQDNMQVLDVLTLLLPLKKDQYPNIAETSIQSENVSCLASHDSIACIHCLNKGLEGLGLTVVYWIYAEAQTGKGHSLAGFIHSLRLSTLNGESVVWDLYSR